MRFDAAIFDVDGVLTPTAALHERAWKEMFDEGAPSPPTTTASTSTASRAWTGCATFSAPAASSFRSGASPRWRRRRTRPTAASSARGVEPFVDAVSTVRRWRSHGLAIAFISSSRNAGAVLEAAGIDQLCDVRVDGETANEEGLEGKPDILREAARRLDTEPSKAVVIEDAPAGVEAAVDAGFALVVGVARDGNGQVLTEHGAHRVVRRLDELVDIVEPGSRPASALPSALGRDVLAGRIGPSRPIVLLDFDGTLSPIVEQPEPLRRISTESGTTANG